MNVFSTNSILELRAKKQSMFSSSNEIISEKSCFFAEALDLIKEENINFDKCIINEINILGFGKKEIDKETDKIKKGLIQTFIDKIYSIIRKIFETFEKMFSTLIDKFKILFIKLGNKDKVIIGSKDLLMNYPAELPYVQERYDFVHVDSVSCDTLSNMYNVDINKLFREIVLFINENKFMNSNNYYNDSYVQNYMLEVRSKLVGKFDGSVDKSNFSQELYKYHRNKTEQNMDNFIPSSEISRIYSYNYIEKVPEKSFKSLQATKTRIKNYSNNILNQIKSLRNTKIKEFSNGEDKESLESLREFVHLVINQCTELCNTYLLSISCKMDAIKDNKIQDVNILIAAINAEKGLLGGKIND